MKLTLLLAIPLTLLTLSQGWANAGTCPTRLHPHEKSFSVEVTEHKPLTFEVEGRTPAERRFKTEEEFLAQAGDDEIGTIEWVFLPTYVPFGHAGFRIGNRFYEFTRAGWKIHAGGSDSARAFLFNNPYIKRQYEKFAAEGVPAYSIGLPIEVKVGDIRKLTQGIESELTSPTDTFNLIFHNCNQCMIDRMKEIGVDPGIRGFYERFSAVLTFRDLLVTDAISKGTPRAYPLPGQELKPEDFPKSWPEYLHRKNNSVREVKRAVKKLLDRKNPVERTPEH